MKNARTTLAEKDGGVATYADLLRFVVNGPSDRGINVTEMRRRLPIAAKIEDAAVDADFGFTPAELVLLVELFEAHKWGMFRREIVELGDELKAAVDGSKAVDK